MTGPIILRNGLWKIMYADDVFIDVYTPSVKHLHIEPGMMVEYDMMWFDVKTYANILKIVNHESLPVLPVHGTTG